MDEPKVADEKLKLEEEIIEEKVNISKDFDEIQEIKSEPLKTNEDEETFPERQKEEVDSKK